jgi:hypothetical protein
MTLSSEQVFTIPCLNKVDPSPKGWSIWTFTDLDWSILGSLPVKSCTREYFCADLEEEQRLLAECDGILSNKE